MQTKTIRKILKEKIDTWLASIDDEKVKELIRENAIVTGGSIVSMLLQEKVNDYDIYFKSKEATKAVAEYYVKKVKPSGEEKNHGSRVLDGAIDRIENEYENVSGDQTQVTIALKNLDEKRIKIFIPNKGFYKADAKETDAAGKFEVAFISSNAITLTDEIQIVVRFHGTPEEIHSNYDFIHATNYFDYKENKLFTNKEALESIITKQLKYSGSLYPVTSVIRAKKFIKRGWNISASEYLKMCFQISLLDLSNAETLEEQLMGVDVAHFNIIIEALKRMKEKDPNFSPTFEWLADMIEKIFNGVDDHDL